MPVKFRCPACQGKLSIARRKAGFQVECPRCGQPITVPGVEEVQDEVNDFLEAAAAQLDAQVDEVPEPAPVEAPARVQVEAPARVPTKSVNAPARHQPHPSPSKRLEDMPLFEQSDIDKYLAPKLPESKPEPKKSSEPEPAHGNQRTVDGDAIILTRASATLLVLVVALLIGMAFCIGYVIGKP